MLDKCEWCGRRLVHPDKMRGRPRKTCSKKCRIAQRQKVAREWEDQPHVRESRRDTMRQRRYEEKQRKLAEERVRAKRRRAGK